MNAVQKKRKQTGGGPPPNPPPEMDPEIIRKIIVFYPFLVKFNYYSFQFGKGMSFFKLKVLKFKLILKMTMCFLTERMGISTSFTAS